VSLAGEHWAKLGFQSIDPAVEINRCGGILNLLHLVYLIENYPLEARRWYSQFSSSGASFVSISFSMTSIAVSAAKNGYLNNAFNKERMLIPVTANLYCGLMKKMIESTGPNATEAKSIDSVQAEISKTIQLDIEEYLKPISGRLAGASS
jgi:hypothetical protein